MSSVCLTCPLFECRESDPRCLLRKPPKDRTEYFAAHFQKVKAKRTKQMLKWAKANKEFLPDRREYFKKRYRDKKAVQELPLTEAK